MVAGVALLLEVSIAVEVSIVTLPILGTVGAQPEPLSMVEVVILTVVEVVILTVVEVVAVIVVVVILIASAAPMPISSRHPSHQSIGFSWHHLGILDLAPHQHLRMFSS